MRCFCTQIAVVLVALIAGWFDVGFEQDYCLIERDDPPNPYLLHSTINSPQCQEFMVWGELIVECSKKCFGGSSRSNAQCRHYTNKKMHTSLSYITLTISCRWVYISTWTPPSQNWLYYISDTVHKIWTNLFWIHL